MPKFRILVVDDSVVIRKIVSEELTLDPALEVVGTAANGKIALARIPQVNPDLVILDIEMPEMDGLAALKEIRKHYPRLPVIMFSSLTERGAAATLDALALGATDYFTKPNSSGGLEASRQVIREELIPEIKTLCGRTATPRFTVPAPPPSSAGSGARPAVGVVAIAASTGGPNALAEVFGALPADLPVPVVIVQHMPPMFTRLLAERLSVQFAVKVQEALAGEPLKPGKAWIAPGDHHLIVVRHGTEVRMLLHQDPPENSCRPAADVLFRSVAQTFGPSALAVVMTGMGQDGLRGCEAIRAAGGQILAQDEATSVVWGMPGYVVKAGLADKVVPLAHLAPEIVRRVAMNRGITR